VRELEALEPMSFSLIAERRRHPPRGAAGGAAASGSRHLDGGRSGQGDRHAGERIAPADRDPGRGGYGAAG